MRWVFLGAGVGAFAILLGVGARYALYLAFFVTFGNFATLCIQYDDPIKRARQRVADQLRALNPHTDLAQRLSTVAVRATADDRRMRLDLMTILNIATGIACIGLLMWAVLLWVS